MSGAVKILRVGAVLVLTGGLVWYAVDLGMLQDIGTDVKLVENVVGSGLPACSEDHALSSVRDLVMGSLKEDNLEMKGGLKDVRQISSSRNNRTCQAHLTAALDANYITHEPVPYVVDYEFYYTEVDGRSTRAVGKYTVHTSIHK